MRRSTATRTRLILVGSQRLADSIGPRSNAEARSASQQVEQNQTTPTPHLDDILCDVLVQELHQLFSPLMVVWNLFNENGVLQGVRQLDCVWEKVFQIV